MDPNFTSNFKNIEIMHDKNVRLDGQADRRASYSENGLNVLSVAQTIGSSVVVGIDISFITVLSFRSNLKVRVEFVDRFTFVFLRN